MTDSQKKESNIDWIGKIPNTWKILKNKYNFDLSKEIIGSRYNDTQLLSLTKNGVREIAQDEQKGKVPTSFSTYQKVSINDLIMCLFDLDVSAVFSGISKYNGMISPAYKCLKCKPHIKPEYADYYFRTVFVDRKYKRYSKNVRFSINADEFMSLPILVPSLNEQKKIVKFLDKNCLIIDSLLSDIQLEINLLEEYKKSIIAESVTRGLKPDVKIKHTCIEWARDIPSHWKVMPNKYIMKKIKIICSKYNNEDILSLTMNGVVVRDLEAGGKMPMSFDGYQIIYPNNLLMCLFDYDVTPRCIGFIKNKGVTSPAYSQFTLINGNVSKYYYYYYLMIDNTKELLHLSKNLRHSFTEEQLGNIKAIVPPIEEQLEISNFLDKKCEEIDTIIKSKKEQLMVLDDYKKSLIYEYVTGKKEI